MAGGSVDKETAVGNCGALALRVLLVGWWLCRGKEKALRVSIEKNLHSAVLVRQCFTVSLSSNTDTTEIEDVNGVPDNV